MVCNYSLSVEYWLNTDRGSLNGMVPISGIGPVGFGEIADRFPINLGNLERSYKAAFLKVTHTTVPVKLSFAAGDSCTSRCDIDSPPSLL